MRLAGGWCVWCVERMLATRSGKAGIANSRGKAQQLECLQHLKPRHVSAGCSPVENEACAASRVVRPDQYDAHVEVLLGASKHQRVSQQQAAMLRVR